MGRPIISKVDPGAYIFFTHNQANVTTGEIVGSFSMMNGTNGSMMFTEVAGDSIHDPDPSTLTLVNTYRMPYSALGVSHEPEYGRYPGGESNTHDLFVWSTSELEGRGENGYTRAFQLPNLFEPDVAPALFTYFLREVKWNALSAPALTEDGIGLVFGVSSNGIRGWTGIEHFHELANVAHDLGNDPEDERLRK
jgi:hypothetical protein